MMGQQPKFIKKGENDLKVTKENEEIAKCIINMFAEKESTVENAIEVLQFVQRKLISTSTVKKVEDLF